MVQNDLLQRMNRQVAANYKSDITVHFTDLELKNKCVDPALIDLQTEIEWHMRPYLLEFMMQVHYQLRLSSKCFFLAVQILDQYCSRRVVKKVHYQLVGLVSLWIASKNQDDKNKVMTLREMATASKNFYEASLFIKMELHILSTLNWNVTFPTLDDCLDLSFVNNHKFKESQLYKLARCLCELSLYDRNLLFFPNSLKSVACVLMAANMLNDQAFINNFKMDLIKFDYKKNLFQWRKDNSSSGAASINTNDDFATGFVETFDDESMTTIRKITVLLINMLANNFTQKSLKEKYSKLKVVEKVASFVDKFNDFLIFNKLNPLVVADNMAKDLYTNITKENFSKMTISSMLTNVPSGFANCIASYALGLDTTSLVSTPLISSINKKVANLSLDLIGVNANYFSELDSPGITTPVMTTPTSPNTSFSSSIPSLQSSNRSNSNVSFSSDESNMSFEVATPPASKPVSVICLSDIDDSAPVSPYVAVGKSSSSKMSPKILDFSSNQKKMNLLCKKTIFKSDGYFESVKSDPIKERKRYFDSDDSLVQSSKRHSPNMRDNYSFYFK